MPAKKSKAFVKDALSTTARRDNDDDEQRQRPSAQSICGHVQRRTATTEKVSARREDEA
jgi:hypothetical protein